MGTFGWNINMCGMVSPHSIYPTSMHMDAPLHTHITHTGGKMNTHTHTHRASCMCMYAPYWRQSAKPLMPWTRCVCGLVIENGSFAWACTIQLHVVWEHRWRLRAHPTDSRTYHWRIGYIAAYVSTTSRRGQSDASDDDRGALTLSVSFFTFFVSSELIQFVFSLRMVDSNCNTPNSSQESLWYANCTINNRREWKTNTQTVSPAIYSYFLLVNQICPYSIHTPSSILAPCIENAFCYRSRLFSMCRRFGAIGPLL